VAFVEAPAAAYGQPGAVDAGQGQLSGVDGAAQHRGVQHVGHEAAVADELSRPFGFGAALVGEVDVDPAGEQVLGVPLALAVAEQDQAVRSTHGRRA
jgi:hypothetical protein